MPKRPAIVHKQARAFYRADKDLINMPRAQLFETNDAYYATLFHELVHSTAHVSRLGRIDNTKSVSFSSQIYSREELVAEMGSAFLCGSCGIVDQTIENSSAYIGAWIKRLKDDKTLIVKAAAQAQKATDYINGITFPVDKDE